MSSNNQGTLDRWLSSYNSTKPRQAAQDSLSEMETEGPSQVLSPGQESQGSSQAQSQGHGSSSASRHSMQSRNSVRNFRQSPELATVAKETLGALPRILDALPQIHARESHVILLEKYKPMPEALLWPKTSSGKTTIKVVNDDSFNAAITMASQKPASSGRVAVLNMASHVSPGGGWLKGAFAQEEALCYRSSLALSLHRKHYPWKQRMGVYTPDVVIMRSDMKSGHKLLDVKPQDLPVVSVISIAALRTPDLDEVVENTPLGPTKRPIFASNSDRVLTKAKMRLCLRIAARRSHGLLVLGALGCGAFKNPPQEIANCWLEVFQEREFQGGWWEEVWFAVYDTKGDGNLAVFEKILGGVEV